MGNIANIEKYKFKPGHSGNPAGRPKSTAPEALAYLLGSKAKARKFYKLTKVDLDTWEQLLPSLTPDQLKLLVKWDAAPAFAAGMAFAMLRDMQKGSTATLDRIRDRQYGAVSKRIELTGADGAPLGGDTKALSVEEARKLISELEAEM